MSRLTTEAKQTRTAESGLMLELKKLIRWDACALIPLGALLLLKQTVFNGCAVSFFYVTVYIFGIKQMIEDMNDFGRYGSIALLVVCNVIFLLYDFNLDVVYKVYIKRIMPRFKRKR